MAFKIVFDDINKISIQQDPDYIWFRAIQDIIFTTDHVKYILKKGTRIKSILPPQIDPNQLFGRLSKNGGEMQTSKYVFLASNIVVNILLSGLISFLWRILGALTSITILSLISVPI